MTVVTYGSYDDRCFFEVSGHACGEEMRMPGENTVYGESSLACAAASILVLTAAEKIDRMQSEGAFISSSVSIEDGYAGFDLEVREERSEELQVIFDTLVLGFELLEENYPDCVSVK